MKQSLLILVSGPAGSGKTTLCEHLTKEFTPRVKQVVTATTRRPRNGERDGIEYIFLNREEFEAKIEAGEFYEHAKVHAHSYGTLKTEIEESLSSGNDLLLNIDVQGAAAYRSAAKNDPVLADRLVSVFVRLRNLSQAKERLMERGNDSSSEIAFRLQTAEIELQEWPHFDHSFISGSKEEDYKRFRNIYLNEKARILG
ncbi:MAG: Guanylate kinase [Candidatus Moanabacter tarae]|uniref:Guanylate kinase n=1 Tax=Candidatus Moanibacter tarae TaxID=2200854 RepID=A0A2Z4AEJ1_9BACT|nr:MAG: Guanylate kinase [Candidatus Moanabacter tarae]